MDDTELLQGFESATLTQFPHRDHVRTAYLLVLAYGPVEAETRMIAGIRGLAPNFGVSPSFIHTTRTIAWTRIIASQVDGPRSSAEFLARTPALLRKDLLDDFYGWGRLLTPKAFRKFIAPNHPFPSAPGGLAPPT